MLWFFLLVWALYLMMLIAITNTWAGIEPLKKGEREFNVSVIVPFRNEARHLERLVSALERQSHSSFEVIFINDHSSDTSLELLATLLSAVSFSYKQESLDETSGKKAAISRGVQLSQGEVILTTDADCVFGKDWVQEMSLPFADGSIQMISGPVKLMGQSLFQKWQQMEFSMLIATGAAGIAWQKPSMANGANLAYRKSVFEEVNGFAGVDAIASGDDELLLMKVQQRHPGSIRFLKHTNALVCTEALEYWSDFRDQRLRWASKWRFGKRKAAMTGAIAVFVFNLSVLILPVLAGLGLLTWGQAGLFFLGRLLLEAFLVLMLNRFFRSKLSVVALLLHQILYPFYAIYFGVAANFGNFHWKGRSYKVQVQ